MFRCFILPPPKKKYKIEIEKPQQKPKESENM